MRRTLRGTPLFCCLKNEPNDNNRGLTYSADRSKVVDKEAPMRQVTELKCVRCGSTFSRFTSDVRWKLKAGIPFKFCGRACHYAFAGGKNRIYAGHLVASNPDISHASIGRALGISRERVRQILGNKGAE